MRYAHWLRIFSSKWDPVSAFLLSSSCDDVIMVLLSRVMMVLATLGTVSHSRASINKDIRTVNKQKTEHPEQDSTMHHNNFSNRLSGREESFHSSNGALKAPRKNTDSLNNYEHLCATVTNTVHLNTRHEEFNPPFYVEKRCKKGLNGGSLVQKCGFDLLHCVQTYTTRHFSRRKAGTHCWEPYSIEVPSGCECMWPIDEFGPIQRKQEL